MSATSPAILRKMPIGIQDFPSLKKDDYLYVDKTEYIYNLINTGKYYFLSRPRRFGKSLLASTMAAYWEGKKELFKGLKIESLLIADTRAWNPHPVFYFDFNGETYHEDSTALESSLNEHLTAWEKQYYNVKNATTSQSEDNEKIEGIEGISELGLRFRYVVLESYRQTGKRVVILVDGYDKPLLEVMDKPEFEERNRYIFKGFFSSLKKLDKYIKFVFITGVTKFEKVSIFSDLNQLEDISQDEDYAGICGITEEEIDEYFTDEIKYMGKKHNISEKDVRERLRATYDGYRFSSYADTRVYNPYSLLNSLKKRQFDYYWFETGTPTFLANRMAKHAFDVRKLMDNTLYADKQRISDYRSNNLDLIPPLYQAGYLTITDYDEKRRRYTLAFPNEEVKYGMLNSLLAAYAPRTVSDTGLDIFSLDEALEKGELNRIRNIFTGLFATIPYPNIKKTHHKKKVADKNAEKDTDYTEGLEQRLEEDINDPFENYFQGMFAITLTLLGQFVLCEKHTAIGRIDCVVKTRDFIYVFEFKRDGNVDEALKQIDEKGYALPFAAEYERKLYKIGVVFDSKKRILKDWKVAG